MKIQVELMNMKNKITILLLAMACSLTSMAQVGIGTTSPNSNAALEISSTSQGILFPRMTTVQRDAISSPAKGLSIFNTDVNVIQTNTGTSASPSWKNWQAPLVLNLDAGNSASYAGSGTAWTDLSGFGNNGTLVNGPTYSSADGGSIVFDGVNDFVDNGNILDTDGTSSFSVSVWFKTSSTASGVKSLVSKALLNPPYTGWQLGFNTTSGGSGDIGKIGIAIVSNTFQVMRKLTTATFNNGIWHNVVFTYNGSKTRVGMLLYINGSLAIVTDSDSESITNTVSNASNYNIGGRNNQVGQVFPGNIANVTHHNRALSASEILQNFNATKSRYGL